MNKKPIIVTHSGQFHADDVLAVAVLTLCHPSGYLVTRTRSQKLIDAADIVVDVGNVYDPSTNRFDHHQPEGAGSRTGLTDDVITPYAAFGLVWKHWGTRAVETVMTECDRTIKVPASKLNDIVERIDKMFVQAVDARDNGIFEESGLLRPDMNISSTIARMNPTPWEKKSDYLCFCDAVDFATNIIRNEIIRTYQIMVEYQGIVDNADYSVHESVGILTEWIDLKPLVETLPDNLKWIVYPTNDGWYILQVPGRDDNKLPENWAGLCSQELATLMTRESGRVVHHCDSLPFCHRAAFIAGTMRWEDMETMINMVANR